MDKTLIDKLKEVIQQHYDLTGEKLIMLNTDWLFYIDGNHKLMKINLNVEK